MLIEKLHVDEVDIDTDRVAEMVAGQFPQWAGLPVKPVFPAGTDNVMFRLGGRLAVRLPRTPAAALSLEKELKYPPKLRLWLPAPIAYPLESGTPTQWYPFRWSVSTWLEGRNPRTVTGADMFTLDIARFIRALHAIAPPEATEELTHYRGGAVAARELETRTAISRCGGHFDTDVLTRAWDIALEAPEGNVPHTWIHTDLHPGNLLTLRGRLSGVLDWGGLAVGDPAVDLIVAWNLLGGEARRRFRAEINVERGMWERGRAWALSIGLVALPYYEYSNPVLAEVSKYQIRQVLEDIG